MFNKVFAEKHPSFAGLGKYFSFSCLFGLLERPFNWIFLKYKPVPKPLFLPITKLVLLLLPALAIIGSVSVLLGYIVLCCVRWIIARLASSGHLRVLAVLLATSVSTIAGAAVVAGVEFAGFHLLAFLTRSFAPSLWVPGITLLSAIHGANRYQHVALLFPILPLLFCTLWLDLYAVSGYFIKLSRRFDIGFGWFNRKFDIEKKPLQSLGLVAGSIVALAYWAAIGIYQIL